MVRDYYHQLLAVNAGIIASIFIFFAIASQVPASTIFSVDIEKCSFGFNLTAQHAQIAVAMVGGILILPFSISSILILIRDILILIRGNDDYDDDSSSNKASLPATLTAIGFGLMCVSAITILLSLSCRIPFGFLIAMIVIPLILTISVIVIIAAILSYKKRNK